MKTVFSILLICFGIIAFGQIPEGYYDPAANLSSYELKTALHNLIKGHHMQDYGDLWYDFENTDKQADGKVWDMYSDIPGGTPPYTFTFFSDQCGNYSGESDCYNREHSFPKSWFDDDYPMYTDLFHLYPTDGYVNSKRGNFPFGETDSPDFTSLNGSKTGPCSYPGYSGDVFEPIDEYKGDFARSYFYMATRYEDVIAGWEKNSDQGDQILDGSSDKVYETWFLNLLLDWHHQDAVSIKEINRNNAVYAIQGNRNPFIDHPEFADCIWLNQCAPEPDTTLPTVCYGFPEFPQSSENPLWIESWIFPVSSEGNDTSYIFYTFSGDTIIQEQKYSKLYQLTDTLPNHKNEHYWGAIRKDTCGKVWFNRDNTNFLLYDFSVQKDDTIYYQPVNQTGKYFLIVSVVDSIMLSDGIYYKRISFKNASQIWIEGVGDTKNLLWSNTPYPDCNAYLNTLNNIDCNSVESNLNCLYKSNKLFYSNCSDSCYSLSSPDDEPNDTISDKDTCISCLSFPTGKDNPVWVEEWILMDLLGSRDTTYIFYTISGDTVIHDTIYSRLFKSIDFWPADSNMSYVGAIRSDSCGHVWFYQYDKEYLLFDYSLSENDTFYFQYQGQNDFDFMTVNTVDSVQLKDMVYHNIIEFNNTESVWIEGIGAINSLLWNNIPEPDCGSAVKSTENTNCGTLTSKLNCFYMDNTLVYKNCLGKCYKNEGLNSTRTEQLIQTKANNRVFSIYPQPVSNTLNIKILLNEPCHINIFNNAGQLMKEYSPSGQNCTFDITDMEPGIYYISAFPENKSPVQVEKLVILR